eukprot:RCo022656
MASTTLRRRAGVPFFLSGAEPKPSSASTLLRNEALSSGEHPEERPSEPQFSESGSRLVVVCLHLGWVAMVLALGWLSYRSALTAELVFDDHLAIEQNPDSNSSTPLHSTWKKAFWGHELAVNNPH